jgi:chaperonin cofactor prefoldin
MVDVLVKDVQRACEIMTSGHVHDSGEIKLLKDRLLANVNSVWQEFKDLKEQVDDLEEQVDDLENNRDDDEDEISEMEQRIDQMEDILSETNPPENVHDQLKREALLRIEANATLVEIDQLEASLKATRRNYKC